MACNCTIGIRKSALDAFDTGLFNDAPLTAGVGLIGDRAGMARPRWASVRFWLDVDSRLRMARVSLRMDNRRTLARVVEPGYLLMARLLGICTCLKGQGRLPSARSLAINERGPGVGTAAEADSCQDLPLGRGLGLLGILSGLLQFARPGSKHFEDG